MMIKIHRSPDGKKVIAVCDSDLVGKKFEQNNLQLDITSGFYKGIENNGDIITEELKKGSCNLNIVGKDSIDFCLKKGFIEKNHIIEVQGIPHAQAVIIIDD